jgi:hypothetical protein
MKNALSSSMQSAFILNELRFMQKTLRLVTILAWGLCIPAYAQAPTFSLPAIPGSGGAASSPQLAKAPENPTSNISLPPALPGLEKITNSANEKKEEKEEVAELPTLDAPPKDVAKSEPADEVTSAETEEATKVGPYDVSPPPLTLDNPAPEPKKSSENITAAPPPFPSLALPVPPTGARLQATAIPEIKVEAKRTSPTWKDVLKPSYAPVDTKFNFRRQLLPPTIYREAYSGANRHLPTARTMPQYDHYFILAAARNDVNAVRAMLANGRRNVNLTNAEGDSVLIVALRHGAFATARLLIARGADTSMRGANGWSAYDYAQYWGNTELLAALNG